MLKKNKKSFWKVRSTWKNIFFSKQSNIERNVFLERVFAYQKRRELLKRKDCFKEMISLKKDGFYWERFWLIRKNRIKQGLRSRKGHVLSNEEFDQKGMVLLFSWKEEFNKNRSSYIKEEGPQWVSTFLQQVISYQNKQFQEDERYSFFFWGGPIYKYVYIYIYLDRSEYWEADRDCVF